VTALPQRTEPTLGHVLRARSAEVAEPPANFTAGDVALLRGEFSAAADSYAAEGDSAQTRAKRGFCLAVLRRDAEAEALLTPDNVGDHSLAQALLAWLLAGDGGRRLRGFGSTEARASREERQRTVDHLLECALAGDAPPALVFEAAIDVAGSYSDRAYALAGRARALYPAWGWVHAVYAARHRRDGSFDSSVLDDLLRVLDAAGHANVFQEAYVYALHLQRFDDANRVVDALAVKVEADPQAGDGNLAALAEMRAMVCLHRGRAGDRAAFHRVPELLSSFAGEAPVHPDGRNPLIAPKFLLEAALALNDGPAVAAAAATLARRCWSVEDRRELADWTPTIATPSVAGVLQFGHFGFELIHAWRDIADRLDEPDRRRWTLLVATDAVHQEEADPDQIRILRDARALEGPKWLATGIYAACVYFEPEDYDAAGETLARLAERNEAWPDDDERWAWERDCLPSFDMEGSEDVVAIFTGAVAWLQRTPTATGTALMRWWMDDLADNGGKRVLDQIATLSLARKESAIARAALARAREPDDAPPTELEAALAGFPDPNTTRLQPDDVSLLEAACLIALLRACPLDHARWTLRPLKDAGQQRFEPTQKFIGTLFDLMAKGVIAADASTPPDVFSMPDGRLSAYLDRVVWRISPHTLELQRSIRDLHRAHWPAGWRSQAPMLARDLGVEEMVVYLGLLLESRSLPGPDEEELRAIFRVQLERLAVAQCYYLAYKTMRETLDYQAKHRPGVKQLQSRVLNLLRSNGQRAIDLGWDTRYSRVKELPPSFLFEALHDVLTGWGQRAFDEPLMSLTIEEDSTPPTRH
jgi:hypothetical protein